MLERFESALYKILSEEVDREKDGLGGGAAIDYADYRRRVGVIEGLTKAIEFMSMAHSDTFSEK